MTVFSQNEPSKRLASPRCLGRSLALVAMLAAPTTALADARCPDDSVAAAPNRPRFRTVTNATGGRTFVVDIPLVVCSRPAKPEVVYIAHPRELNYEWDRSEPSFLPLVVSSVTEPLFADPADAVEPTVHRASAFRSERATSLRASAPAATARSSHSLAMTHW
jgi:hypothetical protein